ncbi:MAG: hypothetical protein JO115_24420 [Pseudonocardiales bacterium]|nr:hypothetical protein [Pseudonocardiales bacterium]
MAKSLPPLPEVPDFAARIGADLDKLKWLLWHGNTFRAEEVLSWLEDDLSTDTEDENPPEAHKPTATAPADTPRSQGLTESVSTQTEPGLRTAGVGTLSALAKEGASRNRAVWYWTATLPLPVRHGDPAGAAQDDRGQSLASTLRKSSSLIPESFHVGVSHVQSCATTHETEFVLDSPRQAPCFIDDHL